MSSEMLVRYEPEEKPPHLLAAAMGAQIVALIVAAIVLSPIVVARTAGLDAASTAWLLFFALAVSGLITLLQCRPIGRFGAGYVLFMGSNAAYIALSVQAIADGGLALMMTLIVVSAFAQFAFAAHLGALRRILTPAVGGIVVMLIAVGVAPIIWRQLRTVPDGFADPSSVPLAIAATLVPIVLISLFGKGMLRLWAPLIGVLAGCALSLGVGLMDVSSVAEAAWIGLPTWAWPGFDLSFGASFWALLPAFALVTLVGGIETYGDAVAVQRIAHRKQRPIDFRVVQGAIYADGMGNLVSGVAGTVPNTVYSTSVAITELTGVAARRVGLWGGLFLILLAFSPKVAALLNAIPSPVAGAYLLLLIVLLFGHGIRLLNEEGMGYEIGLVVCLAFWVGIGFQEGRFYNELLPQWMQVFLGNATTAGGLTAMLLTALLSLRHRSRDRVEVPLRPSSLPEIRRGVRRFSARLGWDRQAEERLMLVVEEALLFFLEQAERNPDGEERKLHLVLRNVDGEAELEFIGGQTSQNLEQVIAELPQDAPNPEDQLSLRLIRGLADEVRHVQFQTNDYLLIRMDSTPGR
jgi:xanthine permease XanP